jgi:hypothetical protein
MGVHISKSEDATMNEEYYCSYLLLVIIVVIVVDDWSEDFDWDGKVVIFNCAWYRRFCDFDVERRRRRRRRR